MFKNGHLRHFAGYLRLGAGSPFFTLSQA